MGLTWMDGTYASPMASGGIFILVILFVVGCALLILAIRYIQREQHAGRVSRVKVESPRYRALVELRARFEPRFWNTCEMRELIACSSKGQFDRFDQTRARQYVIDYVSANESRIRHSIVSAGVNREVAREYYENLIKLPATVFTGKLGEIEAGLCSPLEIHPEVEAKLYLDVIYRSPAGKNNYHKGFLFTEAMLRSAIEQSHHKVSEMERRRQERAKVTPKLRYQVFERDHFRCVRCGASAADGAKLHVDHIVPVSRGGQTVMSNLQTLCETCNLGKGDSVPRDS